ncbi:MAG: NAD(P)/FAD-dependent oxidoreductase [Cytophagales bacterium]|nr:NAD(P)/FAD-dependent oxidoreductase [Cytophagales bacterium]
MSKNELTIHVPKSDCPRVVIIGGGFAGLRLAQRIVRKNFQVVMLDQHNYHTFQPLLYQVATAGLEPDSIAGPLRQHISERKNFLFRLMKVDRIDHEKKHVVTSVGELEYDYLVIATGSKTNYFGNNAIEENAFPLKKIPQALNLRSQILQNFEKAVMTKDLEERERLLNVVIVGGGPTGVELAGALAELRGYILPKDYPELNFRRMKISLIEGTKRLLGAMHERLSARAEKDLRKMGVNVVLNTFVNGFDGKEAVLSNGMKLETRTLIWAAGVMGNLVEGLPEESIAHSRYLVDEFNEVKHVKDVFAIGDVALMVTGDMPKGHPMMAPIAIQQGEQLAKNLVCREAGKPMKPYEYWDKGSMATIGRNKAVVQMPSGLRFGGVFAWFVWMFVHLLYIIGFKNKFVVFANWFWNYLTYDRGNRLIIRRYKKDENVQDIDNPLL